MQIATWNINGLRARLEYLLRWLTERQPDVVGLQELKVIDEIFPREAFEEIGYQVATHGQKAWNGVAILSRKPMEITEIGLPGEKALGARLISADIGDLSFTTVYVPNGKDTSHEDFPRKLAWLDTLAAHAESHIGSRETAILCGDFNICPAPIDSWRGEAATGQIFHTEEERLRFRRFCAPPCGLVDIYRERFPDEQAFSWWHYRAGAFPKGQGLRLDFLLATPRLYERLQSVVIDREYRKKRDGLTPSDHAPVLAEFASADAS
uniref:Exodeoxyribonuclease-3 n=1 Tax=Candidatus Kentrum sp. TUN TaxID=2126343 RepID=A0A450Z8Y2_9GAMM|nr:MAG: exodeoxyribonuclease-3 [Candidatus Kentron sp. TUN]VFK51148.1 MAG: exodeoxyribonuclease-3 [Candidatus Kentron sp. TUN]VFK57338.1 MAG: exodeoxyribonuclease-3 [Candidatus Kentron sp. TUN]